MFFDYFSHVFDVAKKSIRCTQAINELNRLSDRELNDLGLTRGEIYATVYLTMLITDK
jgi:uncharacterized protein YjiS (DUF1127 family)